MQTVNFQCGSCQKLMAVSTEFLGRQVRCPHCQNVVVAPAAPFAATPPAPPPAPNPGPSAGATDFFPSPATDHEDIFASPEHTSDDIFGQPDVPRLEIPSGPTLGPTVEVIPNQQAPAMEAAPQPETTIPFLEQQAASPSPDPAHAGSTGAGGQEGSHPWSTGPTLEYSDQAGPGFHEPASPAAAPGPARPRKASVDWFNPLVFYPLVLYSLVVSGFLAWALYNNHQLKQALDNVSPFEALPDEGDNPGVRNKTERKVSRFTYKESFATGPLPSNLLVNLKDKLTIGALEVIPLSVSRKKVAVYMQGFDTPTDCINDSLVLRLRFRNLSRDQAFAPLDNYFDRYWKPGMGGIPPLTFLQAGDQRFFGGPARWWPRGSEKRREWVDERKDEEPDLGPGETREEVLCTDGGGPDEPNPRVALVVLGQKDGESAREPYNGPLVWRVRVRRGLVPYKGRQVSATAVIGVKFTSKDIH